MNGNFDFVSVEGVGFLIFPMAIITFMSDFGWKDPYVAAIKAKILSVSHNTTIVDITHEIEHFNIPHAAYVTKSIFKDFPIGTVHLVCVNTPVEGDEKLVADVRGLLEESSE